MVLSRIGALAVLAGAVGCLDPLAYPCTTDNQCVAEGKDGSCHPTLKWCVYDDGDCDSGKRFGPAAGDGLAGDCVTGDTLGGTAEGESTGTSTGAIMGCGDCDEPPSPCFASPGTCDEATSTCEYTPLPMGTPCEDDEPCTRDAECDASGSCVPMETILCDEPPTQCHMDPGTCDEMDGTCIYELAPAGTPCEDGVGCTLDDECDAAGTCVAGAMCETDNPCETGMCVDDACVFTPLADGESCGLRAADRCCAGECTDISTDVANCGGCGLACDSAETCESVALTTSCDLAPADTTGRCTCPGVNDACPPGQLCRTLAPAANRCAPDAAADCPGTYVDLADCPNYCSY